MSVASAMKDEKPTSQPEKSINSQIEIAANADSDSVENENRNQNDKNKNSFESTLSAESSSSEGNIGERCPSPQKIKKTSKSKPKKCEKNNDDYDEDKVKGQSKIVLKVENNNQSKSVEVVRESPAIKDETVVPREKVAQSPVPTSAKKKRGRRPSAVKKLASKTSANSTLDGIKPSSSEVKSNVPATSRQRSAKNKKQPPNNHLLTEYYAVRRSDRTCAKDLKDFETKKLEEKILTGCEDGLKVVEIDGKGRGVVATKIFNRGDFIVEYYGKLITLTEAQTMEDKYSKTPDIGCYMYYFNFKNRNYCIDATAESGKLGRLLNHSKNGNCKTKVVGIGQRPYLILVAAKDISMYDELLYDYGDRSKEALEAHPWLGL